MTDDQTYRCPECGGTAWATEYRVTPMSDLVMGVEASAPLCFNCGTEMTVTSGAEDFGGGV